MWILCYAIVSFIIVVVFEFSSEVPEWFAGGHKIFSIINMIASSFLASSIFYFVQSYLPNRRIKKNSLTIVEPILKKLLKKLNLLIYWFDEIIIIGDNGKIDLYPGNYFPNSKIQGEMSNVKRDLIIPKDLKINANQINNLIIALYRTNVLKNLELDFPLNTLMRYFEEDSSYRNTLDGISAFNLNNLYMCDLKQQISEINEAYVILENYYNKMYK